MRIRNSIASVAVCAATGIGAAHAASVQNGNYSGTQANGANISMTVATDPNTGNPQITSFGITISGNCAPSGSINDAWGFGPGTDFVGKAVHFTFSTDYIWVKVALTVSGNNVTGTVTSHSPIFAPYTVAPAKALFCSAPAQGFTMTYQPSAAAVQAGTHGHNFTAQ